MTSANNDRPLTLSVLDQSPIRAGGTPTDAIRETLELARLTDRLGYHRYWVAEHHNSGGLAGAAPEILIARIAADTERLRVGSGGVMLSHYSPLKVAEQFRVLEALYPGRIDLGIGRAPGSDRRTAAALQAGPGALGIEYFPSQVVQLMEYLGDGPEGDSPFAGIRAMPAGPTQPDLWLLGSSDQSAMLAAYVGAAFSFAHFIAPEWGPPVMAAYRRDFRPIGGLAEPRASIGVFAIAADTEAEAIRLSRSRDLWRLRLDRGDLGPFPTVEEAESYPYDAAERLRVDMHRRGIVVGAVDQVKDRLTDLARAYGVDEVVVVTICHDAAARRRSYALLADAFGLAARGPAAGDTAARETPAAAAGSRVAAGSSAH